MKTPRTDAARWRLVCHFDQGGEYDANPKRDNDGEWVPVDVCTQLETELAAMTALTDKLAEALEASDECLALIEDVGHGAHINNVSVARGSVQEAFAAYENHKQNTP